MSNFIKIKELKFINTKKKFNIIYIIDYLYLIILFN